LEVVIGLAQSMYVREIVTILSRLGVSYRVLHPLSKPPSSDCIYVYDVDAAGKLVSCRDTVKVLPNEDPVVVVSIILSKYTKQRYLRVGVDVGERLTVALLLNGRLLGVKAFEDVEELRSYLCKVVRALNPANVTLNVGLEGALRHAKNIPSELCGIKVRLVDETKTNTRLTPLHEGLERRFRRKDLIAAINIALL
jgi:hypothetical protein